MLPSSEAMYGTIAFFRQYYAVEVTIAVMVVLVLNFLFGLWFKKAIGENRSKDPSLEVKHKVNPDKMIERQGFVEFEGNEDQKLFGNKNSLMRPPKRDGALEVKERKKAEANNVLAEYYIMSTRFVSALDEKQFEELYSSAEWQTYRREDVMFSEGTTEKQGIYIVVQGGIAMYRQIDGKPVRIREYIKRGECIGELTLLCDAPWNFTAKASTQTNVVYLSKDLCLKFWAQKSKVMVSFIQTTIGRQWRIARYILYEALRALSEHSTFHSQFDRFFDPQNDSVKTIQNDRGNTDRSNHAILNGNLEKNDMKIVLSPAAGESVLKRFLHQRREDATTHRFYQAGEVIVERGGQFITSMYLLLEGRVALCRDAYGQDAVFLPGSLIGAVEHTTSVTSPFTVRAITNCRLAPISMTQLPDEIAVKVATTVSDCLSPLLRQFDGLGGHVRYRKAGRLLYRRGECASEFFIIVSGRIGVLAGESNDDDRGKEAKFLSGRGDWVGEAAFLRTSGEASGLGEAHSHSAVCIRDTEFLAVSSGAFRLITGLYPRTHLRISSMLALRLHQALGKAKNERNIATVALLPITKLAATNIELYTERLGQALNSLQLGRVMTLSSERLDTLMGTACDLRSQTKRSQVAAWLAEMEEQNRFLLLIADHKDSQWTRLCVRTADHILLVGESQDTPSISSIERSLFQGERAYRTLADTELVLVHPKDTLLPKHTAKWLRPRQKLNLKVTGVHHIRRGSQIQERRFWDRVARIIANHAVGLVLGGGGARGLAHQGVIEACRATNIPIDFIGGTSQGSLMAALYSMHLDSEAMRPTVERFSRRMGSIWELVLDATLPIVSYFSGKRFNETIKQAIPEDVQIEDLWIPFFCITTNVSKHRFMIHRQGSCWKAVRASMSLMEYLPPMLIDGDLLVDGGYLNNLPGDVMRDTFQPAFVVGVDVENNFSEDLYNPTEFGDHLSGFWICYRRFIGQLSLFTPRLRMPKFTELVSAVEYINNTRNIQNLRESGDLDLYIKPMLANTNLLDYHKLEQIEKIGFDAAKQQLNDNIERIPKAFLLPSWELEDDVKEHLVLGSLSNPPTPGSPLRRRPLNRNYSGVLSTSAPKETQGPGSARSTRRHTVHGMSIPRSKSQEGIETDGGDGSLRRSRSLRKSRAVGFKDDPQVKGMTKGALSRSYGSLDKA